MLFFAFQFLGLNITALSMAMSTAFTDSKLSTQIGIFVLFIPASLMFFAYVSIISNSIGAVFDQKPYYGEEYLPLGYVLPHFTFGIILLEFLVDHGIPMIFYRAIVPLNPLSAWICTILTPVFYICLYVYLDAIVPNKYGIH